MSHADTLTRIRAIVGIGVSCLAGFAAIAWRVAPHVKALDPAQFTREAARQQAEKSGEGALAAARVRVIETPAVCLYVVDNTYGPSGIAAVIKADLPAGAGCQ